MTSVSQEIARVRARIHALPTELVREGAEIMRGALVDAARRDTGGDLRLSGVSWQSFDLDVKPTVKEGADGATVLLSPEPLRGGGALWSWLEHGTRAHDVGKGKGRTLPRRRLRIGGEWTTGPIHVRGMGAKRTWSRGIEAGAPKVIDLAERLADKVAA